MPIVMPDGSFRNPFGLGDVTKNLWDIVCWKCKSTAPKYPSASEAAALAIKKGDIRMDLIRDPPPDRLIATWMGHASYLIQYGGVNLLTDPVWSDRASAVQWAGPKRFLPPPVALDELPPIDVVTISHNHYDHLDYTTVQRLVELYNPYFVVPAGLKSKWFAKQSFCVNSLERVTELNWWEHADIATSHAHVRVHAVPAQHWSYRSGFDRFTTLWCGFVAEFDPCVPREARAEEAAERATRRVYHSGDTAYCSCFKEIGEAFGAIDLSLLPIGAYEPRWFMQQQHASPEDSVKIHCDTRSRLSLGMHWGTFLLTDEPVDEPPKALRKEVEKAGLPQSAFWAPLQGETVQIA